MILPIRSKSVADSGTSRGNSFNYSSFDSETRIIVQRHTTEIKDLIRRTAQGITDIGEKLLKVKEKLGHGNFEQWVNAEFGWSLRTANRFMQVTRQFKSANLSDLNIAASALYHLAKPSTPEEARQEALERASQGETITYATARTIVSNYKGEEDDEPEQPIIDVIAEVINDKATNTKLSAVEGHDQDEPESPALCASDQITLAEKPQEEISGDEDSAAEAKFQLGDRICIRRRQHSEDNWAGKTARTWQVTPDGHLRVDVEGHPGVRFTLYPDWVERMPEETPEQQDDQPEQVLDEGWTDEPDPAPPVIAEAPYEAQHQGKTLPQFQAGDRLQVTNLGKSNQQWMGEVAEVVEAAEGCIKVVLEIRPAV